MAQDIATEAFRNHWMSTTGSVLVATPDTPDTIHQWYAIHGQVMVYPAPTSGLKRMQPTIAALF
jgi:hypothetical protein